MFKLNLFGYKKNRDIRVDVKKPTLPLVILLSVMLVGTFGYYYLWRDIPGSNLIDALYMTGITITTVGYGEVHPLDDAGRVFTIIISIAGIGSLFYLLSIWMENLFLIQLNNIAGKRKMMKKIEDLKNHIILIGFGRVGQLAAQELTNSRESFIVIDDDFSEEDFTGLKDHILKVTGDASADDILIKAGIERAKGIIITTPQSATNVFVILSAKELNPDIFVVTRSDNDGDRNKLYRAGADRIVNPYSIGGIRMANLMINTNIIDFMETSLGSGEENLKIENFNLPVNCAWFNKTLMDINIRRQSGASILAVIRDDKPNINPGGDFLILPGDQLVVFGTRKQLRNLEKLAAGN